MLGLLVWRFCWRLSLSSSFAWVVGFSLGVLWGVLGSSLVALRCLESSAPTALYLLLFFLLPLVLL